MVTDLEGQQTKSSYLLVLVDFMETLVPTGGDIVMLLTGWVIVMIGICAATGGFWNIWCCVWGWL